MLTLSYMIRLIIGVFCCICYLPITGVAQPTKQEVEESIRQQQMPKEALSLLEELLEDARKVRYYRERDGDQLSYESKFIWQGDTYSVEFFPDGALMDIEKLIDFDELPKITQNNIADYLRQHFDKTSIKRLQQQFTPEDTDESDEEMMEEFMEQDLDDLTIRYELVVDTKKDGKITAYEMLFDEAGNYLEQRLVVRRASDNILY